MKTLTKIIAKNKKAFHNYEIIEKLETGISLQGCEVKSIRAGQINLRESYAKVFNNELWLIGCYISPYTQSQHVTPEPTRDRKLLIHKKQITRLIGKVQEKGLTLIPLKAYFSKNIIKIEIGLGKAKKLFDKRKVLKEKAINREIERGMRFK